MSSVNLTRTQADQRKAMLNVKHYDIALDLTESTTTFPSITDVTFEVKEAGDTFIDLIAKNVEEVELDGKVITENAVTRTAQGYDPTDGILLKNLSVGEHKLRVTAICNYSRTGEGLHRFVDPADNQVYLYTQFETSDAKRVFACFDQPNLKATYDITVIAPAEWKVITNAPETVTVDGDKATFTSHIDYPLSTYLVAICAGPYHQVSDTYRGTLTHYPETPEGQPTDVEIPMSIYARQSLAPYLDADVLFEQTKQGFDYYHDHFGIAYPFGKYDQLFVPEFNAGAMENAGAVTFRDEYVFSSKETRSRYERRCETILHEMAHMWFGDLVTPQWWDDLWLNESFATWSAAISQAENTEFDTAWVTFANVEKSWAYQQDLLPSTHPISTDASDIETVDQNFDGITYAKGASVLKQLQAYVGREAFFAGVRDHFAKHSYSNATFDDLLGSLEAASGRDLSGWAAQWLKTTGVNTLAPKYTVKDGKYETFEVIQSGAQPGNGELRTHRIAVGLYNLVDEKLTRTKQVELDIDGVASQEVPELVGEKKADVVLVNDDDLTYCLMSLDDDSLSFIVDHIDAFDDPMPRTLAWSAAWEMTRNGQMRARDFVSLVARGAQHETEIAVLEKILLQASTAVSKYADPEWARTEGRELLAKTFLEGARTAEPGSDFQLAFVQALAKVQLNKEAIDAFTALLNMDVAGSGIKGLIVDNGLRWWILSALISSGAIQGEEIQIQITTLLAQDQTSAGQVAAIRAAASENTEENKRRVFNAIVETPNTLTNLALRHELQGFHSAGSTPSLEQFNDSIFELGEKIWTGNTPEIGSAIVSGIYPSWDITEDAITRADNYLSRNDLPTGLRRIIIEGKAGQVRALRNRHVDSTGEVIAR